MLNSLHGKEEYSASQATGALMGFKAENHMNRSVPLFANSIVKHAQDALKVRTEGSETSSESSFGSSGYGSDAEQELDALLRQDFRARREDSDCEDAVDADTDDDKFPEMELETEDAPPAPLPFAPHVEPTTSSNMQAAVDAITGHNGSVPIRFVDGKYAPVFQHLDFLHKPVDVNLDQMSPYEFVACFQRVKNTPKDMQRMQKEKNASDSAADSQDEADGQGEASAAAPRGRIAVTRFFFTEGHPLRDTHHLQLRANQALPLIVGKVPRFPTKRPAGKLTAAYKRDANRFAAWALTLFHPWDPKTGLPNDLSWNRLCAWVGELQADKSIVARTRLAFVTNAAHGLRCNHAVAAKLKLWRFREATRFDTIPPQHQPAAYKNMTSGSGGEQPIFSRASRDEAEKVVNELADMLATPSSRDEKTRSMIIATVNTVKSIFRCLSNAGVCPIALSTSPPISSLSLFAVPPGDPSALGISGAINAYTADRADAVHAENCGKREHDAHAESSDSDSASSCSSSFQPPCPPATHPQPVPTWSRDQLSALNHISDYIRRLRKCFPSSRSLSRPALPKPLRLFICGGPGTGKSTVISQGAQKFQDEKLQIKCGAPTGVAAGSMRIPCATTVHTGWHIPRPCTEERATTRERNEPLPFHPKHLQRLRDFFNTSITSLLPFTTFLDEVLVTSPTSDPPVGSPPFAAGLHAVLHLFRAHLSTQSSHPARY